MDPRFSPSIYGPRASCLGTPLIEREKNSLFNLQNGPRTQVVRDIYRSVLKTLYATWITLLLGQSFFANSAGFLWEVVQPPVAFHSPVGSLKRKKAV